MLGVAGAVREPLMGLHLGGFSGMATGLFTGWVGLLLRPTYGALMSTSQVRGRVRVFLPLCVCVCLSVLFSSVPPGWPTDESRFSRCGPIAGNKRANSGPVDAELLSIQSGLTSSRAPRRKEIDSPQR